MCRLGGPTTPPEDDGIELVEEGASPSESVNQSLSNQDTSIKTLESASWNMQMKSTTMAKPHVVSWGEHSRSLLGVVGDESQFSTSLVAPSNPAGPLFRGTPGASPVLECRLGLLGTTDTVGMFSLTATQLHVSTLSYQ